MNLILLVLSVADYNLLDSYFAGKVISMLLLTVSLDFDYPIRPKIFGCHYCTNLSESLLSYFKHYFISNVDE